MSVSETIIDMATTRGSNKTICPSEVARSLWPDNWRNHMNVVRDAAFMLRDEGKILVKQKGKIITGNTVTGPIRIAIAP